MLALLRQNDQKVKEFILELRKRTVKSNFGDRLKTEVCDWLTADVSIPNLERKSIEKFKRMFQEITTISENI